MYTRKPFSSLRSSKVDPDEVLREVKSPTVPPPPLRSAGESGHSPAAEPTARAWSFSALRNLRSEVGDQILERPFATLGAVFAVGALVGTLLGSRFARIASVVAIGSLLHARRDAFRRQEAAQHASSHEQSPLAN
jgi:hypothetical protein